MLTNLPLWGVGSDNSETINEIVKESKYSIHLEEDLFTFRDKDGKRLTTIEYKDNIYIPLSDKGLFLNYSVSIDDDNVYLQKNTEEVQEVVNINCETIEGSVFTNDDLSLYDYTVIFNWSTWCPDCEDILKNIEGYSTWFEENKVQFVGLLMDNTENNTELREKVSNKLEVYNLDFKNILPNGYIERILQTNVKSIPNFYILDNKGKLISDELLDIEKTIENIDELKENDCNEC